MKQFITHALHDHPEEILQGSIKNCHIPGMHSVMLESSGRKIRMFYTTTEHELWKNTPENYKKGLSIGFHPHHCNITLAPIVGRISNWGIEEKGDGDILLDEYRFTSHINSGKGGFVKLRSQVSLATTHILERASGDDIFLHAQEMHTVGVEKGANAAWMVFEGKEYTGHSEACYSNKRLENWSASGLYTPFSHIDEIKEQLFHLGIL